MIWEKVRRMNRVPGAYGLFKLATKLIYRDGTTAVIRRGPLAGLRWKHYSCYQSWMAAGLYEPHVASLIQSTLMPGDVFYDVGANSGYFALLAARVVGKTGKVVAFDPNPNNARTIREQMGLNGFEDICTVEPVAISGRIGTMSFTLTYVNANAHLSDLAVAYLPNDGERISVPSTTLDEYLAKHPIPSLIKMDIEGAEVAALQGASSLLRSGRAPVLLISTHGAELEKQVKANLSGAGYTFKNLKGFEQMVCAMPPERE